MAWMKTSEALTKAPDLLRGKFTFTFDGIPLSVEGLSFKKRANLIKLGLDAVFQNNRIRALPPVIQIEPTNNCNLKCPLCPSGINNMKRQKGFMSREIFHKILGELGDVLLLVYLYGWGEPFLNRGIANMIEQCTKRGILTLTSTNGQCIQTPDEALNVVRSGLSAVIFAIDGSTQDIYCSYRRGGDIEKVKRCVANIQEAKQKTRSQKPYTAIRAVVNRDNQHDLSNIEKMARDLGVNMFSYKSVGCLAYNEKYKSFEPSEKIFRRYNYSGPHRLNKPPVQCIFPFRQPTVFWDGTIVGCEFDYNLELSWGKIGEKSFTEIWNSQQALDLRNKIRLGPHRPLFCNICPYQDRVQDSCVLSCKEIQSLEP